MINHNTVVEGMNPKKVVATDGNQWPKIGCQFLKMVPQWQPGNPHCQIKMLYPHVAAYL